MFENCRVPVANRIGREGDGFRIAMAGLDGGRLNIGACSIGGAQILPRPHDRLHERAQAVRLAARRFPGAAIPHRRLCDRARSVAPLLLARRGGARSARASRRHAALPPWPSALPPTRASRWSIGCLQLHGGYGYLRDHPHRARLRDVRVHQILEGTNEIMRLIVSREASSGDERNERATGVQGRLQDGELIVRQHGGPASSR